MKKPTQRPFAGKRIDALRRANMAAEIRGANRFRWCPLGHAGADTERYTLTAAGQRLVAAVTYGEPVAAPATSRWPGRTAKPPARDLQLDYGGLT